MSKEIANQGNRIRAAAIISAVSSAAVAAWLPSGAWAQAAGNQAAGDQASQNSGQDAQTGQGAAAGEGVLQEVVVTAERRATNLQTTPISVVAISGSQLATADVQDLNSVAQLSPSLVMNNNGLATTADIRGIGNSNQGGIEQPGVLMIRDGLPNTAEGYGESTPFYDIADVEVLRGPQGTFAGDNSTGGAIYVNSADPNFRGVGGYVTAGTATYSQHTFQGAVNLPVSDTFAMRMAFYEETQGSFYHDLTTTIDGPYMFGAYLKPLGVSALSPTKTLNDPGSVDDTSGRLGLLWKPTDNFQSLTKIEFDSSNSGGVPSQPNTATFSPLAPGLPCPANHGTAPNCTSTYVAGYSGSPYQLNNWDTDIVSDEYTDSYGEQAQYTIPNGIQLKLTGGYQHIWVQEEASTSDDSLDVGQYATEPRTYEVYTGEFDALSPTTGRFSWIAGLSYNYNSNQNVSFSVNPAFPYSPAAPSVSGYNDSGSFVIERSEGVFAQATWQFTPTLQLVAGAREGWDREIGVGQTCTYRPGLSKICNANINGPTDNGVATGKADINWTPVPGQFFYGFIARGYKPGEENLGNEPSTNIESVKDYELGWKGQFAGGHVLTQVGGYYMQYVGLIESIFNPQIPSSTAEGNVENPSTVKGIEVAMQAQGGGFSVSLSGAYNKTELGTLNNAATYKFPVGYGITPQCTPGENPGVNNSICTDYTPYDVSLSGEELPYAPQWTGNASLQYTIPLGAGVSLQPLVDWAYTGTQFGSLFQADNYYKEPSYSLISANLSVLVDQWTVTAYGTNLANKLYEVSNGGAAVLYGNPRQIGLKVNRTF